MVASLDSILNTAASGLRAATAGIGVLSDNVSNAGVANYSSKSLDLSTFESDGQSYGVKTGNVTRSIDTAVQASLLTADSTVGALTVRSSVLQSINATQGTPGDGTSLSDAVTALQSSFTSLLAQPSGASQQSAVVTAATTLANTINKTAASITTQRNSVQSQIVDTVSQINSALSTVDQTTDAIRTATAAGTSTATLEDERDAALTTLSGALNLHYDKQANGDITLLGVNGLSIPLDSRLSTSSATLTAGAAYASGANGSVPPITLQSSDSSSPPTDVTSLLSGGSLGELVNLRDNTLPTYTAQLDQFSQNLATQFSAQGLTLFTNGNGNVPSSGGSPVQSGYVGFSSQIQVNAAVSAKPSLVRDGTQNIAGSATGASSFTTNPSGGPASFSTLISRVLDYSFSTNVASGVPNAASPTTGLGPLGTLSSSISSKASLSDYAQAIVAGQASDTSNAQSDLTSAQSYQSAVSSRFTSGSGVDVDQQLGLMVQLQNSYQANATVLQTTQTLFTALLNAVQA